MLVEENDYLSHYGVKGMRWGVRKAKEAVQKFGKNLGKKINSTSKDLNRKKKKLMNTRDAMIKKRIANDAKKVETRLKNEKALNSKHRQEALSTHDPETLAKYMHLLDYDELNKQYRRLDLEKKVKSLTPQKQSVGKKAVESTFKFLNSNAGQKVVEVAIDALEKKMNVDADDVKKVVDDAVDNINEKNEKNNKKKKE